MSRYNLAINPVGIGKMCQPISGLLKSPLIRVGIFCDNVENDIVGFCSKFYENNTRFCENGHGPM